MNRLKKLILTMLLLCSTTAFAKYPIKGFDTPKEGFLFYYKLAEKAVKYKDKNRYFKKEHINALVPYVWSRNNPPRASVLILGDHYSYTLTRINMNKDKAPFTVDMQYRGPVYGRSFKTEGVVKFYYTQFKFQKKKERKAEGSVHLKARKIGNKIKWFLY